MPRSPAARGIWLAASVLVIAAASFFYASGVLARFTSSPGNGSNTFSTDTMAAPTSLTAAGGSSIVLNWTATTTTYATGHRVYRSNAAGGPYTQIAQLSPKTTTTYTDSPSGGTYYYVVRAYYQNWQSANSGEVSASVIAFVKNVGTVTDSSGLQTLVLTVPSAGVAASDFVVVRTAIQAGVALGSVTDSRGNSYALGDEASISASFRGEVWYSRLATSLLSGDTITVTWAFAIGARRAISVDEFTGVAATKDVSSTASGSSTTPSANVTTTYAADLIIGYTGVNGPSGDSYTEAAGWNALTRAGTSGNSATVNATADGGYKIVSATGSYTHSPTLGTSRGWTEVDVAFKGQ